jgi:hypothetical protein
MNATPTLQSPPSIFLHKSRVLTLVVLMAATVLTLLIPRLAHADVPGRVGRIAFMQGDVQAYSETDPEWKVAYINEPITSRNSVFVGDSGRAEISVGSTTLAMDAGSQVDIQQLDDNTFNANVVRGRVSMRVRRLDPSDVYNVAVPGAEFALLQPGRYRIDALEGASGVTVFAGQASVTGDRGAVLVNAGNAMRIASNPSDPNGAPELLSAAPVPSALDEWVVARESRFRDGQAQRYVSPNMTGYEDLDANGRWSNEADVGPVWYPTTYVQADWAPYRYGRWAYVAPWGYTWIDDAPWGFAPFHYGRWLQVGGRWGWCPGAYVARPAFAPALVGFYGGNGFQASFSIGVGPAVGWYPLAPWQRYSPHYTQSAVYINQVNNITVVRAPTRFVEANGGVEFNRLHGGTIAPQEAFASQRSISRVAIAAPRNLSEHAASVNVAELPRPANVPGAVRRGPEAINGNARPEFRSPREFATRPAEGGGRSNEGPGRAPAAVVGAPNGPQEQPRAAERSNLPQNYRRLPEEPRATSAPTPAAAAPAAVERPNERGFDRSTQQQQPRGPNAPSFSRDARPIQQPVAPTADTAPNPQRFNQREQIQSRNPGEVPTPRPQVQPQIAPAERQIERPNREMRSPQPPQQPAAQPQAAEQRQQRFERPAPVAQPQPQPQPQAVEQRQPRIERAPVAPVAPVAPAAQAPRPAAPAPRPEPAAPRGEADRGDRGPNRDR